MILILGGSTVEDNKRFFRELGLWEHMREGVSAR